MGFCEAIQVQVFYHFLYIRYFVYLVYVLDYYSSWLEALQKYWAVLKMDIDYHLCSFRLVFLYVSDPVFLWGFSFHLGMHLLWDHDLPMEESLV